MYLFKIYGYTYQDKDLFSDIVSLSNLILKVESKDKSFSTNIPYIGNAIEVSDIERANIVIEEQFYYADYIHYNPNTNTAKRYKVIDENLIDYSIPLIDQFQAFLSEPVIEDIEMTMDEYFFENIKSIQDECKISLNSIDMNENMKILMEFTIKTLKDIEFDFDEFDANTKYTGIEYENTIDITQNLYKYIGEEKYLYYHFLIPYKNSYVFSYNVTTVGAIIVRFFDYKKNNISLQMVDLIENSVYDENERGILINNNKIVIPFQENSIIKNFQLGFKVGKNTYFSDLVLKKQ